MNAAKLRFAVCHHGVQIKIMYLKKTKSLLFGDILRNKCSLTK